jgi:hypothetical protein
LSPRSLAELGAWDLDPRRDDSEAEAAAALCCSVGYWAVPYPVAERLARPVDVECDGLVVVDPAAPAAELAGLDLQWIAVDVDGHRSTATPRRVTMNPRKDAFVAALDVAPVVDAGAIDVTLGLFLPCWTLRGMLDRAMERISVPIRRLPFGLAATRAQLVGRVAGRGLTGLWS